MSGSDPLKKTDEKNTSVLATNEKASADSGFISPLKNVTH